MFLAFSVLFLACSLTESRAGLLPSSSTGPHEEDGLHGGLTLSGFLPGEGHWPSHGALGTAAHVACGQQAAVAPSSGTAVRRSLAVSYQSSATNGSASATFPSTAFAAWCATDAACAAAGSLNLSLLHYTDASPFTSVTLNWPNVFSGAGISSLQLVSGVLELQFSNYSAKQDQLICSFASPCVAQLSIPLTSSADPSMSFVCLRLEPSVTGSGYQASGYPPGSNGTAVSGIILNGALRCNTTKFGKHIMMQYKQSAALPASPPPAPSPPLPPPLTPPLLTGATYTSDVQLQMLLPASLSFDTLKANNSLLGNLTASLTAALTGQLGTMVPAMLLLSTVTNSTGTIRKISRLSTSPLTAVSIEFRLVVPAGATEGQIAALQQLIATNTTALFSGSPYTKYFLGSATVTVVDTTSNNSLSTGAAVAVAVGCMLFTILLGAALIAAYRWHVYSAILPKKPDGEYDKYGEALVQPNKSPHKRRHRDRAPSDPTAAAAAAGGAYGAAGAGDAPYSNYAAPQSYSQGAQKGPPSVDGGSVVPPPWNGANGSVGAGAGVSSGVPIGEDTRGPSYAGRGAAGAAVDGGGGGGGAGLRSHAAAQQGNSRMAWM